MDINDPITANGEFLFCEYGHRLALEFLSAARDAVEFAVSEMNPQFRQTLVFELLRGLHEHTTDCPVCNPS